MFTRSSRSWRCSDDSYRLWLRQWNNQHKGRRRSYRDGSVSIVLWWIFGVAAIVVGCFVIGWLWRPMLIDLKLIAPDPIQVNTPILVEEQIKKGSPL